MKLSTIIKELDFELLSGSLDIEISSLVYDSRKVTEGSLFVVISGTIKDAHEFIPSAIEAGAKALIVTKDIEPVDGVTIIKVSDAREALALTSAAWFDYPAKKLTTIGITGTKGKTTTTYMVKKVLELAGIKTGLIGTIETIIGDTHIPASHSTPESYVIQEQFAKMVEEGITTVIMEVSSQGLKMKRVAGIIYDIGVFTNLSPDHIGGNEHPTFEDYVYCKSLLFKQCKIGLFNRDDIQYSEMTKSATCSILSFGTSEEADYIAKDIILTGKSDGEGISKAGIKYTVTGRVDGEVVVDIPGRFTVYNSLTALAICNLLGVKIDIALKALSDVKVKGRVETVKVSDDFTIMVDYAHNEMSLRSVLSTLREYEPKRLVCVFGCGGNRSKDRRFSMGRASGELADYTIITSDNPRFEEPEDIMNDIKTGIEEIFDADYIMIADRDQAIKYALAFAKKGDLILVAGKGHEDYQEIKGVKYPMDDVKLIEDAAKELGYI